MTDFDEAGDDVPSPAIYNAYQFNEMLILVIDQELPRLPPICVKTGKPIEEWVWVELQWTPFEWHLLGLLGLSPVQLIFRRSVAFYAGISSECLASARQSRNVGYVSIGLALALLVTAGLVVMWTQAGAATFVLLMFLFPVGMLLLVIGIVLKNRKSYGLKATEIRDHYARIQGVHPNVLAQLPRWPRSW